MKLSSLRALTVGLALTAAVTAQPILINEVHGFGAGAAPVLPGDYLELWNQGSTDYSLAGHTIQIWAGDTAVGTSVVVPCQADGRHIIPANGFWVMQESAIALLGMPNTGTLTGIHGMRGLPASWSSSSSMGAKVSDAGGNCVAYVYLRRASTALPVAAPNLGTCAWTLGNVGTTGASLAHIQRLTNANTNSVADWGHDATTNVGTPGAINTTGAATQTSIGPIVPIAPGPAAWETNSPECSFDFDGGTNTAAAPINVNGCINATSNANFASTLIGLPYDLAVGFNLGVAPTTLCTVGTGITTAGGQTINIDLADPFLFFLNNATFTTLFAANFNIPILTGTPIPNISAQMVVADPGHPDGVRLSSLAQLHILSSVTNNLTLTDDSTVAVNFPTLCGGPASIPFCGTTYTSFFVNSNGRVMFGAAGDTDNTATVAEALLDNPAVGCWTDLNPAGVPAGTISVSTAGSLVSVNWNGTVYFATANPVTFSVVFDPVTGVITVNTTTIPENSTPAPTGTFDAQFLGLSRGAAGAATNGGPTVFAPAGSGSPMAATDMIYDYWDGTVANAPNGLNRCASLQTGLASIVFTPSGSNYTWAGF